MNEQEALAELLFPTPTPSKEELAQKYPARALGEGACVTRFAPSPTGYMHIGGLLSGLISERVAHQSNGVFFLRIEDTDKKREVEGAVDIIFETFRAHDITVDEGVDTGGDYAPYKQSERLQVYRAAAKELVAAGRAYPCFCTTMDLQAVAAQQEAAKERPGYRGSYARCRTLSVETVRERVAAGTPYVIRLKSRGVFESKIPVTDLIKGLLMLSQNDIDTVLLKSDGYPTYHLAHVVDDHYMGTTHVLRGDEWLSSTPLHLELWDACGWQPTEYGHIAPIQKIDESGKRKLSKRKDPEADMRYYDEQGYPPEAVIDYLMNLANSNFEDWRKEHPTDNYRTFPFSLSKLNRSGALFDEVKLGSISREIIARMTPNEQYERIVRWLHAHDSEFAAMFERDHAYVLSILSIERDTGKRKDVARWSDVRKENEYFFDEFFAHTPETIALAAGQVGVGDVLPILEGFLSMYDPTEGRDAWFARIKTLATTLGYAAEPKEYRKNPESYRGHVGNVAQVIRVAVTGRTASPDLHAVLQVLGEARVRERCAALLAHHAAHP